MHGPQLERVHLTFGERVRYHLEYRRRLKGFRRQALQGTFGLLSRGDPTHGDVRFGEPPSNSPPARAAIIGAKQPGRDRAGPDPSGLVRPAGRDRPDLEERGRAGRVGRKSRRRDLAPGAAAVVGAVQLRAEVAVLERRIDRAVARVVQHRRHRHAGERRVDVLELAAFCRMYELDLFEFLKGVGLGS